MGGRCERQQRNLAEDQRFIAITADLALTQFRRLIDQRLAQEREGATATPTTPNVRSL